MADFEHNDIQHQWKAVDSRERQRQPREFTELQIVTAVKNDRSCLNDGYERATRNLKTSRVSQTLRKWKAQSRKHAATVVAGPGSPSRAGSRSGLQFTPLRSCLSLNEQLLYSDGEGDEEGGDIFDKSFPSPARKSPGLRCGGSRSAMARLSPARTLSCPKLGSPLNSCTPLSRNSFDGQMRSEGELEWLQPSGSQTLDSCGNSMKGSSPLKLNLAKQPSIPKGYVAMYVGEERKRFLVKANVLNHPLFGVLLDKAREEFGFQQKGPLNIPCKIAFFQHIILLVQTNDPFYQTADPDTILHHVNRKIEATQA